MNQTNRKNGLTILIGNLIVALIAAPAVYAYHLLTGAYSSILDGSILPGDSFGTVAATIFYLAITLCAGSLATSLIFYIAFASFRFFNKNLIINRRVLEFSAGFSSLIYIVFMIWNGGIDKINNTSASFPQIIIWIFVVLLTPVILNVIVFQYSKNTDRKVS